MKKVKRKFERHWIEDDRDFDLPVQDMVPNHLNESIIYKTDYGLDQGSTPMCVGYAGANFCRCEPRPCFLKPDFLYTSSQHFDEWEGTDYDGTSVRALMKVLKAVGLFNEYYRLKDPLEIILALKNFGPVIVGTNWYEGMNDYKMEISGNLLGGHAYVIYGCNAEMDSFFILNSHGEPSGFSFMPVYYFWRLLDEDGEAWSGDKKVIA